MSKFSVGEMAEYVGVVLNPLFPYRPGDRVEIIKVGPGLGSANRFGDISESDYYIDGGKGIGAVDESSLRKLPPDSTEDPGLTRIKKLLLQDIKQKEREHESA